MDTRTILAASLSAAALLSTAGCAVGRGQQSVGAYVDDTALTTRVKSKFAEDNTVSASSISVETLNGEVQLSGFAKSAQEKEMAEKLARETSGVTGVKNSVVIRP